VPGTSWKKISAILSMALLTSAPPFSYSYELPLESHSIRDGYFLGQRNDQKTAELLEAYSKHLPLPNKGPWVSEIKFFTPYANVVDVSRRNTIGYSAQQAEQDFKERGNLVRVYVRIEFTQTYGFAQATESDNKVAREYKLRLNATDFWRDFQYKLLQTEEPPRRDSRNAQARPRRFVVDPVESCAEPIYDARYTYQLGPAAPLLGAIVCLDYDGHDVLPQLTEFQVLTPDGQRVSATFDLTKLR
jgi:hypothetical protein